MFATPDVPIHTVGLCWSGWRMQLAATSIFWYYSSPWFPDILFIYSAQ